MNRRKEFETWFLFDSDGTSRSYFKRVRGSDEYVDDTVALAYRAWKASRETQVESFLSPGSIILPNTPSGSKKSAKKARIPRPRKSKSRKQSATPGRKSAKKARIPRPRKSKSRK